MLKMRPLLFNSHLFQNSFVEWPILFFYLVTSGWFVFLHLVFIVFILLRFTYHLLSVASKREAAERVKFNHWL